MPIENIPMNTLIIPGCKFLSDNYGIPYSPSALAYVAAFGYQESKFEVRDQLEVQNGRLVPGRIGPATSFWQMEKNGGVKGVMTHPATKEIAKQLVAKAGLPFDYEAVWTEFAQVSGDELATLFARLLIYTHSARLGPATPEGMDEAWKYYLAVWRPGKPRPDEWPESWNFACSVVRNEFNPMNVPTQSSNQAALSPSPAETNRLELVSEVRSLITHLNRLLNELT